MRYETIIGVEVHVEPATKSKMFCECPADHFGITPNTQTCPVCLGLPGALPVPNKKAVEWTILLGKALGSKILSDSKFDRKNYFYPDLPKGYQISQYDEPLCLGGSLKITTGNAEKTISIRRVHLEEDTGRLQHGEINGKKVSLVDFNRSGVPLMEIVTEPDFRTLDEVDVFLKELQKIIRYLGISKADMEKGSMRLEPSISLRPEGESELPSYRVELKNINSFRFARKALQYEIDRQAKLLDQGEVPVQQTRGWNESKNETFAQREKEEAHDYRYFPEPDIPPMHFDEKFVNDIASQIPELPGAKSRRFQSEYGLTAYSADLLCENPETANYFEEAVKDGGNPPDAANWIINKKVDLAASVPGELVRMISSSKTVTLLSNDEIDVLIDTVIETNPDPVRDYRQGKIQALGVLIGKVVKVRPSIDKALLADRLKIKLT